MLKDTQIILNIATERKLADKDGRSIWDIKRALRDNVRLLRNFPLFMEGVRLT